MKSGLPQCHNCRDYQHIPELDRYDMDQLDDEEYEEMSISERQAAEREMRRRDGDEGFRRGYDDLLTGVHCHIIKCSY